MVIVTNINFSSINYASVGGATRHTVVVVSVSQSVSLSVATISRSSLKTNR